MDHPVATSAPIPPSPLAALALPGETSPVALTLPETLGFDNWQEIGARLCALDRSVGFWIGDWWAFGEHRYGRRSELAAAGLFGRAAKSLSNAASVARAITTSRRRELLSFAHHAEVVALPPEHADALLDRAEQERLSVRALRKLVRAEQRGADPAPASPPRSIVPTDPREAVLASLRPALRRHLAAHGRRVVIEALQRLRGEVENNLIPLPAPQSQASPHACMRRAQL